MSGIRCLEALQRETLLRGGFDKDRTLQNVPSLYPHSTFYTHYTCHVLLHSTVQNTPSVYIAAWNITFCLITAICLNPCS